MKIVDLRAQRFRQKLRSVRDADGRARPGAFRDTAATLVTVVSDDGAEGYAFGSGPDAIAFV
jgi:hypothetical protein